MTTSESASSLALDGVNVYWINNSGSSSFPTYEIREMPKAGGPPVTLWHENGAAGGIVSDDAKVYFIVVYPGFAEHGAVCTGTPDICGSHLFGVGHDGSPIADYGWGTGVPSVDDQFVYVSTPPHPGPNNSAAKSDLQAQPKDRVGVQPTVVNSMVDGRGSTTTLWGGELFWALAYQDQSGDTRGEIRAIDLASRRMRVVYGKYGINPGAMKVDVDWVYFRDRGGVYRVARTGGDAQLLWQAPNGTDIDANASVVYWNQSPTSQFPGCLGRANSDGTDGRCLDEGPHDFRGVRVDDSAVYYIKDGQIWRILK
ncbi:MAG TPA: hypothetical protein VG496_18415 [Myxococcales bacterium]|nr:hypothetical protein [Myxococcales bacterium]